MAQASWAARRWDAVVSHWLVPSGIMASLARKVSLRRIPHLAIAHSADVHLCARDGLADLTLALLEVGGPTQLLFVGEHLKQRFLGSLREESRGALRALVSPMGIDVARLTAARTADRSVARRTLGLPAEGPVVGFLGRLVPVKGVDILIDAVAMLAEPLTLLVAGDGPERGRLVERAQNVRAIFPGALSGASLGAFWAAIDVFVLPSVNLASGRTEGTPTVVLEALAAGVPVIASEVGGVRAAAGDAAVLVPSGDRQALAGALSGVLRDPKEAAALAERGRVRARAYDWHAVGPRLLAALVMDREAPFVASSRPKEVK
jgi:glycosyltransferase involved in cell wall biosynthesis